MAAIPAPPADSASYGVSPIAMMFPGSMPSFRRAARKMSGSGLLCATSSDEVFASRYGSIRVIILYARSSSSLAEEASAIAILSLRRRSNSSRSRGNGLTFGRYWRVKSSVRSASIYLPQRAICSSDRNTFMSLSPPLPICARTARKSVLTP